MPETPYWQVGEVREQLVNCEELVRDWDTFTNWVAGLPERFEQLKVFADSGRAANRTKLGHELIEAWRHHRSKDPDMSYLLITLADAISFRVISWARACDYHVQPDPAILVVIED